MKKYIVSLSIISSLIVPQVAFAQASVPTCPAGSFGPLCNVQFSGVLPAIVTTLFIIAVVVALLYLIYGGFRWIMSGGDKAAVTSAREHIVAAIVGLVIIFLAYFIVNIVMNFFGLGTLGTFTLPTI